MTPIPPPPAEPQEDSALQLIRDDEVFIRMTRAERFQHLTLIVCFVLLVFTGLPLLIWGPPYCSAVRWAQDNLGVAEVVDEQDPNKFAYSVKKLVTEPKYRSHLADNAFTQGNHYFAHHQITQKFYQSIT